MTDLMQLGQQAKDSAQQLALMPTNRKNELLVQMAQTIKKNQQAIIEANHKDLEKAVENNISETMQDRLQLTPERNQCHGYRDRKNCFVRRSYWKSR